MGLLRFFKSKSTQCLSVMVNNDLTSGKIFIFTNFEIDLKQNIYPYPILQIVHVMIYLTVIHIFYLIDYKDLLL